MDGNLRPTVSFLVEDVGVSLMPHGVGEAVGGSTFDLNTTSTSIGGAQGRGQRVCAHL